MSNDLERAALLDAVLAKLDSMIVRGKLPGNDEAAQRDGIILSYNALLQMRKELCRAPAQPEVAPAAPAGEPADTLPELTYPVTHGCIHFRDVTPQGYVYHKLVRKEDYDALRQHAARLQAEIAGEQEKLEVAERDLAEARRDLKVAFDTDLKLKAAVEQEREIMSITERAEAAERTVAELRELLCKIHGTGE